MRHVFLRGTRRFSLHHMIRLEVSYPTCTDTMHSLFIIGIEDFFDSDLTAQQSFSIKRIIDVDTTGSFRYTLLVLQDYAAKLRTPTVTALII